MPFTFTQDVPIGEDIYGRLLEALGPEAPHGLLTHVAFKNGTGLSYVDVWESRADFERFVDERLHPALSRVFKAAGFAMPAHEPETLERELVHMWDDTRSITPSSQSV